jgi:hypothetical protein
LAGYAERQFRIGNAIKPECTTIVLVNHCAVTNSSIFDGNAKSTAQATYAFRGIPPHAILYAVPEFILVISANRKVERRH